MFSQIRPRTKDLRAADRVVQSGGPNAHGDHGWRPTDILSASLPYGSNHNQDGSGVSPRPLENGGIRQPDLINGEINVLAVGLQPRRNGSGHFIVLRLTGCEYQEAVCYSEKFPFTIAAGQRVRVRGRRGEYRGKSQIVFRAADIQLVSEPADNVDLITIDVTVGGHVRPKPRAGMENVPNIEPRL
jgi:hypothetical protein